MYSPIADLLQCPQKTGEARCGGALAKGDGALVCDKCSTRFRIAPGEVPVFRPEENGLETTWYEGNYQARSRKRDMSENALAEHRAFVAEQVKRLDVQGPSLDVGCGTGIFAEVLPGFVGLDYSLQAVTSEGTEQFSFVCGAAESLPFRDGAVGCVFSHDALEHVPLVDLAFEELDRVLKPGGTVILKPAWHSTWYQTELLPIKPYGELSFTRKLTKALLPVLTSRPVKLMKRLPRRIGRRLFAGRPTKLTFDPLTPNFSEWIADSDAAASIDCHEGILFFESRGYRCLSHPGVGNRLLAGHDWIILSKPDSQAATKLDSVKNGTAMLQ